jgi:hypothetical protein
MELSTTRPTHIDMGNANGITPLAEGHTDGKVYVTCACCHETSMVIVAIDDYRLWTSQKLIAKEAFPYITIDKLTFLESGLCLGCFDVLWTANIHNNPNEALHYPDDDDRVVG